MPAKIEKQHLFVLFGDISQGRKRAMKMLKNMLQERRRMQTKQQTDFFDYIVEELKKEGTILTEAIALDLMFVLLFASFETTSLALTYAIKLLSDNPLVLKRLQVSIYVKNIIKTYFHGFFFFTSLVFWLYTKWKDPRYCAF